MIIGSVILQMRSGMPSARLVRTEETWRMILMVRS